jgi:hypothetical protein
MTRLVVPGEAAIGRMELKSGVAAKVTRAVRLKRIDRMTDMERRKVGASLRFWRAGSEIGLHFWGGVGDVRRSNF